MIHLLVPETDAGRALADALQQNGCATIAGSDGSLRLPAVDERARHALRVLKAEGLMVRAYDYAWLMCYLREDHLRQKELFFLSVNSFRKYVVTLVGDEGVGGVSTLSQYQAFCRGRHPDWTFTDAGCDATERLRRIQLAARFASAFVHYMPPQAG